MKRKGIEKFTDEELAMEIAKSRDSDLFGELYSRYEKIVFNKCFNFTTKYDVAEDLTQDIFLKLFLTISQFSGRSRFSTWFYSFTYNHCVNHVTRNQEYKISTQSRLIDDEVLLQEDEVDDEILMQLKYESLELALEKIQAHEKMILLLKYQDDATIKELSEFFNIGESAVKMRLSRAKKLLLDAYNLIVNEN